jgi:hypothetical protein
LESLKSGPLLRTRAFPGKEPTWKWIKTNIFPYEVIQQNPKLVPPRVGAAVASAMSVNPLQLNQKYILSMCRLNEWNMLLLLKWILWKYGFNQYHLLPEKRNESWLFSVLKYALWLFHWSLTLQSWDNKKATKNNEHQNTSRRYAFLCLSSWIGLL